MDMYMTQLGNGNMVTYVCQFMYVIIYNTVGYCVAYKGLTKAKPNNPFHKAKMVTGSFICPETVNR